MAMINKRGWIIFGPVVLVVVVMLFFVFVENWNGITSFFSSEKEEATLNSLNITCKENYDTFMRSRNLQQRTILIDSIWVDTLEELEKLVDDYGSGPLGESYFYGPMSKYEARGSKKIEFKPNYALIIKQEGNGELGTIVRIAICNEKDLVW